MCKLLCFQSAPGEKKIPNFTLLGLHYTSFRPTDPPAQDVRTQNLNTSVSALRIAPHCFRFSNVCVCVVGWPLI